MRKNTWITSAALLGALAFLPLPTIANAQSSTRGLMISPYLFGTALNTTGTRSGDAKTGGGLGVGLGWGFASNWAIVVDLNAANMTNGSGNYDYTLRQAMLALRYNFSDSRSAMRPYVEAGLAGRGIETDYNSPSVVRVSATGGGLAIGGGLQYYFSPSVAFEGGLRYIAGSFDTWKNGSVTYPFGNLGANSTILKLGVSFWPGS